MEQQAKKVLIVASFGPENAERCPAPFLFAQEAVKGGAEAGICFVLQAPLLLSRVWQKACMPNRAVARSGNSLTRVWLPVCIFMPATQRCSFVI